MKHMTLVTGGNVWQVTFDWGCEVENGVEFAVYFK